MCATHLDCPKCGAEYESEKLRQLCDCGAPLLVRYNLNKTKATLTTQNPGGRNQSALIGLD